MDDVIIINPVGEWPFTRWRGHAGNEPTSWCWNGTLDSLREELRILYPDMNHTVASNWTPTRRA